MEKGFKNTANKIKLPENRKAEMRAVLSEYVAARPAPIASPYTRFVARVSGFKYIATSLAAAVLVFGGFTFAAGKAGPGSALYAVKVHMIEEVYAALITNPEDDVEWSMARASRRLEEAAKLVQNDRSSPAAMSALKDNFMSHAADVQERIKSFDNGETLKAAEISSKFATTLSVYESVLAQIAAEDEAKEEAVSPLGAEVHKEKKAAENARRLAVEKIAGTGGAGASIAALERSETDEANAGGTVLEGAAVSGTATATPESSATTTIDTHGTTTLATTSTSTTGNEAATASSAVGTTSASIPDADTFPKEEAEKMKRAARGQIERIGAVSSEIDSELEAETRERVNAEIDRAKDILADGDGYFEQGRYGEAFLTYQDAFNVIDKVALYLKAETDFGLDILPGLIPLLDSDFSAPASVHIERESIEGYEKPANDENVAELMKEVAGEVKRIRHIVENDGLSAREAFKARVELRTIRTLLVRSEIILKSGDVEGAYRLAKEAERLTEVTRQMIAGWRAENGVEQEPAEEGAAPSDLATSTPVITPAPATSTPEAAPAPTTTPSRASTSQAIDR